MISSRSYYVYKETTIILTIKQQNNMRKLFSMFLCGVMLVSFSACEQNDDVNGSNGHKCVDLGLPSGTLWATCNVGADSPEEYGDYFAWGETTAKEEYDWTTYKYGNDSDELTKYCTESDYGKNGFTDNKTVLEGVDDAATANWGGDWRMPTLEEQQELCDECDWEWTTDYNSTGVAGYIVSSKAAGNANYIFLPAASYSHDVWFDNEDPYGYYWSSSLREGSPYGAFYLQLNLDYYGWNTSSRFYGRSVRPVRSSR